MTGQQIARNSLQYVDEVFYFPFDLGFIVNRTLRLVKPKMFIMMETEIWPNLLRACHRAGVRTVLVNGRISSRSYPRYRLARPFFRRVLANVDRFCMQSEESARRIIDMGADPDRVVVTGSLKFDSLDLPGAATAARIAAATACCATSASANDRPVIIAASTLKGEEDAGVRGVPADSRAGARRAADHRAAQARAVRRGRAAGAARRVEGRAPQRAAGRRRAPAGRRRARHHRRAGAALPGRHGGLRRRQPRRPGRAQHPRAGRVRQADRVRALHAELRRDRARVRRQRRRDPDPHRRASSSTR